MNRWEITFERILKETGWAVVDWDSPGSRQEEATNSFEHDNELPGCIKC
jgi:hypothetical protein